MIDQNNSLGITLRCRRKTKGITIKGLSILPIWMSYQKAMTWATGLLEQAVELRGYEGEDSPVDQHVHLMHIAKSRKQLSIRNTIRLYFAVNQIINNGPTYFTQNSFGGMFNVVDMADYSVPDVRLKRT